MILEQANFFNLTEDIELRDVLSQKYNNLSSKFRPSGFVNAAGRIMGTPTPRLIN